MQDQLFPKLGFGLGLRQPHHGAILEGRSTVDWFEIVSENYMIDGGRPLSVLEKIRQDHALAFHGVSLSIGSTDPLNFQYLKKLKDLIHRFNPAIVSDHCCWIGVEGENLHDLLPLPFTEVALRYFVDRVKKVQDFLGRRILVENLSSYLTFKNSEMTEWEFLSAIATEADCGLLLDVNNVYVSSVNHGFDPVTFLNALPLNRIGQIHLAGHISRSSPSGKKILIDSHSRPVCAEVWDLYQKTIERFGKVSTMVEWDADIPEYETLEAEVLKAKKIEENFDERTYSTRSSPQISKELSVTY